MGRVLRFTARLVAGLVAAGLLIVAALTALAPADLQAWVPPPLPALPATKVVDGQVVGEGLCEGPRHIAVDAAGRVYSLCRDGDIVMLAADASTSSTSLAKLKGGTGLAFGPRGGLVIAAGRAGLFHVGGRADADPLVAAAGDPVPLGVSAVDDLKLTPGVLLAEASDRPGRGGPAAALLEHAGRGSLYRYDLRTKRSTRLLDGLQTPLAVAVGPDDRYALVAETGAYRILRVWLEGPRAGTREVFADGLPGFVTALSFNRNGRFWATLETLRHPLFDRLAAHPRLRGALSRLPWNGLPGSRHSLAMAFDADGAVTAAFRLQDARGEARMTSVVEHGPWLWIGGAEDAAIVRVPLQSLAADALPPPPGWESAPRAARPLTVKPPEDDD